VSITWKNFPVPRLRTFIIKNNNFSASVVGFVA